MATFLERAVYLVKRMFFLYYVQGVNKVRRHCSISYNFRINVEFNLKTLQVYKPFQYQGTHNTTISTTILYLIKSRFLVHDAELSHNLFKVLCKKGWCT